MRIWLIETRKRAGMSQHKVAEAVGISQSYYASIESGMRGKPLNVDIAKSIASVLSFDWTRFYEGREGGNDVARGEER